MFGIHWENSAAVACRSGVPALSAVAMGDRHSALEALIARVAAGDRIAFRELYDASANRMFEAARRILGDAALAEDAVQDAYVRIWRHAAKFDPARGVALAWMGRIVRNTALDRLPPERDMARIEDLEIADIPVEPADARVLHCLRKLPEQQSRALLLTYVHGLTNPELASHMDAPLGTVKAWIRRGAQSLRECMGPRT